MLSLGSTFKNPASSSNLVSTPITEEIIIAACDRTSRYLNNLLGTDGITIQIASNKNTRLYENFGRQWGEKTEFEWHTVLSPTSLQYRSDRYTLGLFLNDTLCALSDNTLTSKINKRVLEILRIENAPEHVRNPLQGFAIAAASQVNWDIAQQCGIQYIGAHLPRERTVKTYEALGYYSDHSETFKKVGPETKLDIPRLIARRTAQGLIPSNY
jgi:hypothetical protein